MSNDTACVIRNRVQVSVTKVFLETKIISDIGRVMCCGR